MAYDIKDYVTKDIIASNLPCLKLLTLGETAILVKTPKKSYEEVQVARN